MYPDQLEHDSTSTISLSISSCSSLSPMVCSEIQHELNLELEDLRAENMHYSNEDTFGALVDDLFKQTLLSESSSDTDYNVSSSDESCESDTEVASFCNSTDTSGPREQTSDKERFEYDGFQQLSLKDSFLQRVWEHYKEHIKSSEVMRKRIQREVIRRERQNNAKRRSWTHREVAALLCGIDKHGLGAWVAILSDGRFKTTLSLRNNVNLKDKWRLLKKGVDEDEPLDKKAAPTRVVDDSSPVVQEARPSNEVASGTGPLFYSSPVATDAAMHDSNAEYHAEIAGTARLILKDIESRSIGDQNPASSRSSALMKHQDPQHTTHTHTGCTTMSELLAGSFRREDTLVYDYTVSGCSGGDEKSMVERASSQEY